MCPKPESGRHLQSEGESDTRSRPQQPLCSRSRPKFCSLRASYKLCACFAPLHRELALAQEVQELPAAEWLTSGEEGMCDHQAWCQKVHRLNLLCAEEAGTESSTTQRMDHSNGVLTGCCTK